MLTLKSYKSFEALLRLGIYWVLKSKLHARRTHAKLNPFGLNFLLTPKQQRHNQRLQTSPAAHRTSPIILSDERKQGIYCVWVFFFHSCDPVGSFLYHYTAITASVRLVGRIPFRRSLAK